MPASERVARNLSQKLMLFRAGLSKSEQDGFDNLLKTLGRNLPSGRALARVPQSKKVLAEVRAALDVPEDGPQAITPTVTTVTITTTVASHPGITCN